MIDAFDPHTHARSTDPDTSHAAAERVTNASEMQGRVLAIYAEHPSGLTDEELIKHYDLRHGWGQTGESKVSPRKRRSDLTRLGWLIDVGERRRLASGRNGVVWFHAS